MALGGLFNPKNWAPNSLKDEGKQEWNEEFGGVPLLISAKKLPLSLKTKQITEIVGGPVKLPGSDLPVYFVRQENSPEKYIAVRFSEGVTPPLETKYFAFKKDGVDGDITVFPISDDLRGKVEEVMEFFNTLGITVIKKSC